MRSENIMTQDTKTFLITGVAGFIGSTLACRLLSEGKKVVGIDNLNDYYSVGLKKDTPLNATSAYGKSKIEAEGLINELANDAFRIATLRPPMVYGKGCKGNYPRLAGLALKTPIFPNIDNKRSMIYIDNLSEFVKQLIDNRSAGLFFPQNTEYVNTSEMVKIIAEVHGKKIIMTKLFNPLLRMLNVSTINKVFGDLVYEMSMSEYKAEDNKNFIGFKESIELTEG